MTFTRITKQLDRLERRADSLRDALDWYAAVLFDEDVRIRALLEQLKLLITHTGDTAELQKKIDELQAQVDAGSAAIQEATTQVQSLSDTGEDTHSQ